jgi:hypothetical protein
LLLGCHRIVHGYLLLHLLLLLLLALKVLELLLHTLQLAVGQR